MRINTDVIAPRLGIARLGVSATRGRGVSPVFLALDLASRVRERPGAGADTDQVVNREDASDWQVFGGEIYDLYLALLKERPT